MWEELSQSCIANAYLPSHEPVSFILNRFKKSKKKLYQPPGCGLGPSTPDNGL
jgi:hypothetical protein